MDNEYYILLGDFNLALRPDIDTVNYMSINNPRAREKLLEIMEDLKLIDYFRVLNPDGRIYTWHKKTPLKRGRLDYILISESLSNCVETYSIKPGYRSDHSIVIIELKFNSFNRGRGLWKFNNSLLSDKEYVKKVKDTIHNVCREYIRSDIDNIATDDIDDNMLLDVLLMKIRGITISYSSYKKKEREKEEMALMKEIEHLESFENMDVSLIEEKRLLLENLRKEKMEGHAIRSRARWIEEGEKPTRYFCNSEKRNYLNKTIKKLEVEGNRMIYDQAEILNEVKKLEVEGNHMIYDQAEILNEVKRFYQNLYANKDSELLDLDLEDIIKNQVPKLDKHTSEALERPISEKEIFEVLKNMKNNKSPGSDGYSVEFFKFFWSDLKEFIFKSINCIFSKKELPISQRLGIISCLPKGEKPRQFLKNWRPITLLNVLYKLISGCLSNRIKSCLNNLISDTQSGFIKGRYIGENTRFIYDLMHYIESKNIPGLLVLN